MSKIKVFVVDDHPIFLQGLRLALESDPRIAVAGAAIDSGEALTRIKELKPQVAVVDIDMPQLNGMELTAELQKLRPPIPVVILTMHKEERLVHGALERGARGYVLKDNALNEVLAAVLTAAKGGFYITPSLSGCLIQRNQRAAALQKEQPALAKLTPMERMVLGLVAANKTSRQIAKELFISHHTVDTHRANICAKLSLRGSHKLLEFALTHRAEL